MLSYKEYQLIAKKMLFKSCNKNLSNKILKDNDAFGELISEIMIADWKFNLTKCENIENIYPFRKQRCDWFIKKYIKQIKSRQQFFSMSGDTIDKVAEEKLKQKEILKDIFDKTIMSEREISILKSRLEGQTLQEIGIKNGISRQRIKQLLSILINKIKEKNA